MPLPVPRYTSVPEAVALLSGRSLDFVCVGSEEHVHSCIWLVLLGAVFEIHQCGNVCQVCVLHVAM